MQVSQVSSEKRAKHKDQFSFFKYEQINLKVNRNSHFWLFVVGNYGESSYCFTCSNSTIETLEKGVKYVQTLQ